MKGAVCNLSCQAYFAALQRVSSKLILRCRHSKQMLCVVIYQDCGKLILRHQCVKLILRPLSLRCDLTLQQAYFALPVCQAYFATTVHYTASLFCAVTSQAYFAASFRTLLRERVGGYDYACG